MSYLRTIKNLSAADNLGGILTLYIARKADVVSIPDENNGVILGDVVFVEGAGWTLWEATFESKRMRGTSKSSQEGASRDNSLAFQISKDDVRITPMLSQAEEDEFIVLFAFPGGRMKLFGVVDAPVQFSYDHDSGSEFADGSKYTCRFYYDGPENSFYYYGALTIAPPSYGSARVEFSTGELIALLSPSDILIVSSDFAHTFTHIPGTLSGIPSVVKWDTGEVIASMQPGDILIVDTDFTFDFELIETAEP